jgi:hypothetical protein
MGILRGTCQRGAFLRRERGVHRFGERIEAGRQGAIPKQLAEVCCAVSDEADQAGLFRFSCGPTFCFYFLEQPNCADVVGRPLLPRGSEAAVSHQAEVCSTDLGTRSSCRENIQLFLSHFGAI